MEYVRPLAYQFPLMRGDDVRAVQQALIALKVQPSCASADGIFGISTAESVKGFQHSYNVAGRGNGTPLSEDGEVEAQTWANLFSRAKDASATASRIQTAAAALSGPLPGSVTRTVPCLSPEQVRKVRDWMSTHFEADIAAAISGTPVDPELVYAIACQETASIWLGWIDRLSPEEILARCVFDASGDAPHTNREAFPTNTAAFRSRMGDALTDKLIAEANATRALRNLPPANWVYKGYGIFQYDLQNISSDGDFFGTPLWGDFKACMDRLMRELGQKLSVARGDLREAVARYNGGGAAAQQYCAAVMQMRDWCSA